jgi:hypothetical protein
MALDEPRPSGLNRVDVVATVVGLLAALLVTWGVKEGLARVKVDERVERLTQTWPVDKQTRHRIGRVMEREIRPLLANPRFIGDSAEGFQQLRRGLARLSDAELAAYQAVRKKAVFASERACVCLWDHTGCSLADDLDGLARLSEPDIAVWYGTNARAVLAELDATSEIRLPSQADFYAAGTAIEEGLPEADRRRLLAFLKGRSDGGAETCFALRTLCSGLESLDPARRATFTRGLICGTSEP